MAAPLSTCTKIEQRGVVGFLWAKNMEAKDIHKEMLPMYGEHCLSRQAVHNWVQKFSEGRTSIEDEHRAGRPVEIATPETLQRVEDIIRAERRVTVDAVATAVGCSRGQAYSMMHEGLGFHKVCSRWVPRQLTPQHKSQRMGLSLQHLQRYQDEGDDMLSRIVTGDESWVHHYEPETKRASMQWKHPSSPAHKKFKVTPSAGKVMLTVFWDCQGVLLTEFQQRGHTVTSASYCTILTKLRAAIRRKRPGLLTKGVLLLHDNARPHSANQTTATLRSFKWEVLQHPPYSPDLAPSDFHLFGPLKHHLSGERFPDDPAVERAVRAWFRQQPKEFFAAGFQGLVKRWDKCLNLYGDYVEK